MKDTPGPLDYGRALRLIIYTAPDRIDLDGINATLSEIQSDGRATQAVLSLCTIAHAADPALRTDVGIEALRQIVAGFILQLGHDG